MDQQISAFDAACHALEAPASHASAARYLEDLRASPAASVHLARGVLSSAAASLQAQMHAAMLLRTCTLSAWAHLGPGEAQGVREWLLSTAAAGSGARPAQVTAQLVLAAAVLWKRGWVEEAPLARAALFDTLAAQAGASPSGLATVVRLCCALVQEFGAGPSGKATALGMPAEWHAAAAASFQASGLRPALLLALRPLLDPAAAAGPAPDLGALLASAEALLACTAWDFEGGCGRRRSGRLCPGPAWRDLLADARCTVLTATLALHARARAAGRAGAPLACTTRAVLVDLCGMEGGIFRSQGEVGAAAGSSSSSGSEDGSAVRHALCLLSGALPLLAEGEGGSRADALQRASEASPNAPLPESDWEEAYSEGAELHGGLATLLRVHGMAALAAASPEAVSALLTQSAGWIGRVLMGLSKAAEAAAAAAAGAAAGAAGSSAASALGEGLRWRSETAWAAVDVALELWTEVCGQAAGGGSGMGSSAFSQQPLPLQLQALCQSAAGALFDALLRARCATATALLACEEDDDDNPYEDASALENHLAACAVLARASPRECLTALAARLGSACEACRSAGAGGGGPPVFELLWWLSNYAVACLTDPGCGERPEVPPAINALCTAHARAGRAAAIAALGASGAPAGAVAHSAPLTDPVIQLCTLLLSALQQECGALLLLCSSSAGAGGAPAGIRSPLLLTTLLAGAERWARTYLMPEYSSSSQTSTPLSLSLSRAFGAGPLSAALEASAAPIRIPEAPLSTLAALAPSTTPGGEGSGGGRGILEFLVQAAGLAAAALARAGEPAALDAAISLLHRLCTMPNTAPHTARTPALAPLARYASILALGGSSGAESRAALLAAAAAAHPPTPSAPWLAALPALLHMPAEAGGRFTGALLALTRSLGAELPGHAAARGLHLNNLTALGPQAAAAAASGAGGLAIVAAMTCDPAIHAVLARWAAYSHPFYAALAQRAHELCGALGATGSSSSAGGGGGGATPMLASHPGLDSACCGLFTTATAIIAADPDLPGAWVLPGALPALTACVPVLRASGGRGPAAHAALAFARDFLKAQLEYPSPALAEHIYGLLGGVFECYGGERAVGLAGSAGSAGAGAGSAGKSAAEELWETLLLLLDILQCLCDSDTVSFSSGAQSSDTVLKGLSLLLPLLSPTLLAYPRVSAAYMTVAAHIVSMHPTQAARLTPGLFSALIASLVAGLAHHDTEVVEQALSAVKGLGTFHSAAREAGGAGGALAALDLSAQLASAPQLFHTLAQAVLSLALGVGSGGSSSSSSSGGGEGKSGGGGGNSARGASNALNPTLVSHAAEALLACICAEPAAFQGAAQAMLGAHAGTHGAALAGRLAAALTELTQVRVPSDGRAGSSAAKVQVPLTLRNRLVREAFTANFQDFVTKMAGVLTIL